MRLRQVALVAKDLDPVVDDLCATLGIEVAFNDPGVEGFGLKNAVMPIGDTFLEVICPVQEGTTAGRLLKRRGGDGGYMVIVQTQDLEADRARMDELGVRIVWEIKLEDAAAIHLHPRDIGGAIFSFDAMTPPDSWRWAGPIWQEKVKTGIVTEIIGAEIQSTDPAAMAARWAQVLALETLDTANGTQCIPLEGGYLRFVPDTDGRGEGVSGIDLTTAGKATLFDAARSRGLETDGDSVKIGGVTFRAVE